MKKIIILLTLFSASIFFSCCRSTKDLHEDLSIDLQRYASAKLSLYDTLFVDPMLLPKFQMANFTEITESNEVIGHQPANRLAPVAVRKITAIRTDSDEASAERQSNASSKIEYPPPSLALPFYTYIPLVLLVLLLLLLFRWAAMTQKRESRD